MAIWSIVLRRAVRRHTALATQHRTRGLKSGLKNALMSSGKGVAVLIYVFFYFEFYRNQNWLTHVDG